MRSLFICSLGSFSCLTEGKFWLSDLLVVASVPLALIVIQVFFHSVRQHRALESSNLIDVVLILLLYGLSVLWKLSEVSVLEWQLKKSLLLCSRVIINKINNK